MSEEPLSFRRILEQLREPLFVLSSRRELLFGNQSFRCFTRIAQSTLVRPQSFWPLLDSLRHFSEEFTTEFSLADGENYFVRLAATPLEQGATLFRILGGYSKNAPVQNFHSQRLETLGLLSGAIAHDFNNILTGILGHTTYLKTILPSAGPHVESLAAIEDGTRKGSSITQQILNFSKLDSQAAASSVSVSEVITRTCTLLRRALPPRYTLEVVCQEPSPCVLCIESQLAQVLVNLVINARDAIQEQGTIQVRVSTVTDPSKLQEVFAGMELSSSRYTEISVSDTGVGITEDMREKIFEPYFSTKKGKGTGLGLSTVASIIRSLGGAVRVESTVGVGTTVSLFLPVIVDTVTASEAAVEVAARVPRGSETILIVDDEYPVRNVLVISLQHLGYSVHSASSGAEALEMYVKNPGIFDLIIMDMLMPQMSGDQLFFELKKLNPEVRALVISGFSSDEAIRGILANGGKGFIPKPFTIEELARTVRLCLDQ